MIGQSPEKVALELEYGIRERDKKLAVFQDQLKGYVSPFFERDLPESNERYNPENHVYEYISFVVPQLIYNNPRVALKSRVFGTDKDMAMMRYVLNAWVQDNNLGEDLTTSAHDFCFNFAAAHVLVEDHPYLTLDDGSPAHTCKIRRLSQYHYVRDPGALSKGEARWEAHEWHEDKEDLLARAKAENEADEDSGWNVKAIQGLATVDDADDTPKRGRKSKIPDRKQVRCFEVWIKDAILEADDGEDPLTKAEGFHGVILTFASQKGAESLSLTEIREPRAYYGPPDGPYAFGWVHYVCDDPFGLSPLVAVEGQIRDLNLHARTMSRRASTRKRPIFVDETDFENVAQRLQDAEDDEVIGIQGFDSSKVSSHEIGGLSDQDLAYTQIARERLERVSGLSEQQRGIAGNADSATEAAIAKEGGDIRLEYTKLQFQRFVRSILRKVAWYFHEDDTMRHALPPQAAEELGIPIAPGQVLIVEGGNPTIPFDQLGIEIEPLSMERTTTASNQRRATELFGLLTQVAQMIPAMPWLDWGTLMDILGEAYNVPRMGELVDFQLASQLAQVPLQPGMAGPQAVAAQAATTPSQPRPGANGTTPANRILSGSPFSGFSQGQKAMTSVVGAGVGT